MNYSKANLTEVYIDIEESFSTSHNKQEQDEQKNEVNYDIQTAEAYDDIPEWCIQYIDKYLGDSNERRH